MVNLTKGLEYITEIIKECIKKELKENGVLSDVESFIPIFHNESGVNEPCIWMVQHLTTVEKNSNISQTMQLKSTFEFVCVEYDPDPEIAEAKGQNLASRVGRVIAKNYLCVQDELDTPRIIHRINFNTYYPVGEVEIKGKADKVPATSLVLDVIFSINWINCCKNE